MNDKMKELYHQLYVDAMKIKLSNFFPVCGAEYGRAGTIRLMVIGRAVNGWDEFHAGEEAAFMAAASRSLDGKGFSWLGHKNKGGVYDDELASEPYLNGRGEEVYYDLRTSPYWRTAKEITRRLNGWDESGIPTRWYEYIVWSNLYAIAPKDGGNPDDAMQKVQRNTCRELLVEQIREYAPTHILFITGQDWFNTFWNDRTLCQMTEQTDLERYGKYPVSRGIYGGSKVVVTMRPEFRTPADIIGGAVAAFEDLEATDGAV
jgi:hypothetical protein